LFFFHTFPWRDCDYHDLLNSFEGHYRRFLLSQLYV
jgi:hypothetical protein